MKNLNDENGKKYPILCIEPPEEGTSSKHWGTFQYDAHMPWGCWFLTDQPKDFFKSKEVMVLECKAEYYPQDESGVAVATNSHFLVGQKENGEILWWHLIGDQRYNSEKNGFDETILKVENEEIVIMGYGWDVDADMKIFIDPSTGEIQKIKKEDISLSRISKEQFRRLEKCIGKDVVTYGTFNVQDDEGFNQQNDDPSWQNPEGTLKRIDYDKESGELKSVLIITKDEIKSFYFNVIPTNNVFGKMKKLICDSEVIIYITGPMS